MLSIVLSELGLVGLLLYILLICLLDIVVASVFVKVIMVFFFFQAEDGIRDLVRSRGLGDVYKRQGL